MTGSETMKKLTGTQITKYNDAENHTTVYNGRIITRFGFPLFVAKESQNIKAVKRELDKALKEI
jgi:hypothetical protein